jgi:heptosyltransferase-2
MNRRILIMLREHIGDVVNSVPALRSIRGHYPGAHIAAEVGDRAADLLRHCPYIDEIWPRPQHQGLIGKLVFIARLRARRFDTVFMLDDSNTMVLLTWLGGIRERYGIIKRKHARLFTRAVQFRADLHETLGNFRALLDEVGVDTSDWRLELFPAPGTLGAAKEMLSCVARRPMVGIHPGASLEPRRWFPERFAAVADEVASRFGAEVALLGGPEDADIAAAVRRHMTSKPRSLVGRLTLDELVAVISLCDVLVTNDSGPMHVAAATGTPVVALFGFPDPRHTGPGGDGHVLIRKVDSCPGCSPSVCVRDKACLRKILPEDVVAGVADVLARSRTDTVDLHSPAR